MIDRTQLATLTPAQRSEVIFRHAQSELAQGLWRAALGDGGTSDKGTEAWVRPNEQPRGLDLLLSLIGGDDASPFAANMAGAQSCGHLEQPGGETAVEAAPAVFTTTGAGSALRSDALGANARFAGAINHAADRTGLPATALASIVDAEAARGRDGSWNIHSRNPRSSAAGLGQFLSGTWEGEAERTGTWLNGEAKRRGWLNGNGQVSAGARGELLALRYDPDASIQAIADYAARNVKQLENAGVRIGDNVESIARAAYLGHHLGPGDAARFLTCGLDSARARKLLNAQVGQASAARRISEAGDAANAHRQWLTAYIDRRIQPERYA